MRRRLHRAAKPMARSNKPRHKRKSTTTSPLLDLPAELRNTIYHLVLASEPKVVVNPAALVRRRTALLRTCSQIRAEATALFYASNTFSIECGGEQLRTAVAWLKGLDANKAALIKTLAFRPTLTGPFEPPGPTDRNEKFLRTRRFLYQQADGDTETLVKAVTHSAAGGGLRDGVVELVFDRDDEWRRTYGGDMRQRLRSPLGAPAKGESMLWPPRNGRRAVDGGT